MIYHTGKFSHFFVVFWGMVIDKSLPFFSIDTLDSYIKSVESTVFAYALQEIKHEGVTVVSLDHTLVLYFPYCTRRSALTSI